MLKGKPLTAFLLVAIALSVPFLAAAVADFRFPGDDQGYEPRQPIAFSHRLHAGEMEIACLYCHSGADKSRHAGIPPLAVCMNCHRAVVSPEITKIHRALETGVPVVWNRVHDLPDFVYFDHRPHVAAGVECAKCHGPVETMERVRQEATLSMGMCVNCHRGMHDSSSPAGKPRHVSTDCSRCHY